MPLSLRVAEGRDRELRHWPSTALPTWLERAQRLLRRSTGVYKPARSKAPHRDRRRHQGRWRRELVPSGRRPADIERNSPGAKITGCRQETLPSSRLCYVVVVVRAIVIPCAPLVPLRRGIERIETVREGRRREKESSNNKALTGKCASCLRIVSSLARVQIPLLHVAWGRGQGDATSRRPSRIPEHPRRWTLVETSGAAATPRRAGDDRFLLLVEGFYCSSRKRRTSRRVRRSAFGSLSERHAASPAARRSAMASGSGLTTLLHPTCTRLHVPSFGAVEPPEITGEAPRDCTS